MDSSGADSSSPPTPVGRDNSLAPASDVDAPPPPPSTPAGAGGRVKLMVSYGGRIQPRPHDNTKLSYVGGETKILALDRSARLPALLAKIASVAPSAPDLLCLKYQLPGEDLDALVSVTDDDDLEHLMVEYDRLQRSTSSTSPKTAARLRLFLFPVGPPPPPPSAALLDSARSDRQWFLDVLNAVPAPSLQTQPLPMKTSPSPDFLFGLDEGFVPPPAVKVTVDPQPPLAHENLPLEAPAKPESNQQAGTGADPPETALAVVSAAEIQRQTPELHKLQIPMIPPPVLPRNSSEETLSAGYPTDYQVPPAPEKAAPPATAQWPDTVGRYASLAPGHDQTFYLLQASPGMYPGFYAATPRMFPAEVHRNAAAKAVGGGGGVMGTVAEAYATAAGGGKLAYDSSGRVVYYAGVMPTYQTVTSAALNPIDAAVKAAKPSQIA